MTDLTNPFHLPLSTAIPKLSALIEELQKEQAEMLEQANAENPEVAAMVHGVYGTVLSGLSSFTACLSEGGRDPSMPKRVFEALEPLTNEVIKSHTETTEDKVKSALNDALYGKSRWEEIISRLLDEVSEMADKLMDKDRSIGAAEIVVKARNLCKDIRTKIETDLDSVKQNGPLLEGKLKEMVRVLKLLLE